MENEIVLTFDFELAPTAEDLGEVLAALSRDYREGSNGATLVVARIDSGSIIVTLTDAILAAAPYITIAATKALEAISAINAIGDFAANLKKWFCRAKTDEGKKNLYKRGKKASGQRSVEAIIKTAAKSRCRAKVKYTKPNGETLEAEITPAEAIEIRSQTAVDTNPVTAVRRTKRESVLSPQVTLAIETLRQAGSENLSQSQIEAVVQIVVAAVKSSGAGNALPAIASQLERHGLLHFAAIVRRQIDLG